MSGWNAAGFLVPSIPKRKFPGGWRRSHAGKGAIRDRFERLRVLRSRVRATAAHINLSIFFAFGVLALPALNDPLRMLRPPLGYVWRSDHHALPGRVIRIEQETLIQARVRSRQRANRQDKFDHYRCPSIERPGPGNPSMDRAGASSRRSFGVYAFGPEKVSAISKMCASVIARGFRPEELKTHDVSGLRTVSPVAARPLVRAKGLEPPRLASLEPKSSASTNSATPAAEQRFGGLYITDCARG